MSTRFSNMTHEEFFRYLVSRPDLTVLEREAMLRIEDLLTMLDKIEDELDSEPRN